jgi:hypothetical protein
MMKKDNTMTLNLEVKGNLAKLLATENIIVQHNNVKTASFDVKNRILTLPIFKEQSGDVYDMLIAHECSHALFTPYEEWEGINDSELRSYVNVIEDTRIDKLIQAKYPGVVKNYMNGFDILEKKNFFGLYGKDINKDLMIIDKINIRSKSLNRVPFNFNDQDNEWLTKVDKVVTFKDVVDLAKEMLAWQKEQVEEMAKLPNFDELSIVKSYDLGNDDDFDDEFDNQPSGDQGDESDEKNDFNNFGDEKGDDEKEAEQEGASDKSDEKKQDDQGKVSEQYGKGADGEPAKKLLKAVTDQAYENKKDELLDSKARGFVYGKMPEPNLKSIVGYKQFLKEMQEYRIKQRQYNYDDNKYMSWLKDVYKRFQKENKKTVMYLVKEFEMKKAATAYKRASTDKTGIIDPLKLPNYKFSDDIFKRLTIVPDGKNHGMMMLLDWSGSMSDTLMNTVEQLLNLVEFVKKVNIPFEVYFFTSERNIQRDENGNRLDEASFNYKDGDWMFEDYNLVNCFSHRMTKKEFELASMYMYHMAQYYNSSYVYHKNFDADLEMARYNGFGVPGQFYLGNTPLNEALVFCSKLIPMFKSKYDIEKMTFITLTDGGANSFRQTIKDSTAGEYGSLRADYDKTSIIEVGKKKLVVSGYGCLTSKLLKLIKSYDVNVIGFYILKRVKRWDIEQYMDAKDYSERARKTDIARKQMTKDKAIAVNKDGYDKYFLLDGKRMQVENFDMNEATVKKGTASELKRIFGKSMANRLVSRVVLNKFIQEVA